MAAPILGVVDGPLASRIPAPRLVGGLLVGALLLSAFSSAAEQRFLGSPDGSYKVTLISTGDSIEATMQRLLIPNRTLWQQTLPGGAELHSGYVSNTGELVVINAAATSSDVVLVVVAALESAPREYRLQEINEYLAQHAEDALTPDQWNGLEAQSRPQGGVLIALSGIELIVDSDLSVRGRTQP